MHIPWILLHHLGRYLGRIGRAFRQQRIDLGLQRIAAGKDAAAAEKRELRDGEITPACAQSCPSKALVFGDLNDPESEVARLAESPRGSKLLEDLGTAPKVTYLRGADGTKVEISGLPPQAMFKLWEGSMYIQRLSRSTGEVRIETPSARISIENDSIVRIDVLDKGGTTLSVRTGRANASFVDKIMVDYYGAMVPMQQLATFQVPEARQLVIKQPRRATRRPETNRLPKGSASGVHPNRII